MPHYQRRRRGSESELAIRPQTLDAEEIPPVKVSPEAQARFFIAAKAARLSSYGLYRRVLEDWVDGPREVQASPEDVAFRRDTRLIPGTRVTWRVFDTLEVAARSRGISLYALVRVIVMDYLTPATH